MLQSIFFLSLHKIGCTRQFVSELTLRLFALSLHKIGYIYNKAIMNTLELQTEYRGLVDIIANKDADTIRRAIQALKKIVSPSKHSQITKKDLVIDPRVSSMYVDIDLPATFDYKEEYCKEYMKDK